MEIYEKRKRVKRWAALLIELTLFDLIIEQKIMMKISIKLKKSFDLIVFAIEVMNFKLSALCKLLPKFGYAVVP